MKYGYVWYYLSILSYNLSFGCCQWDIIIASDNGLVLNRQQAIIWNSTDPVH